MQAAAAAVAVGIMTMGALAPPAAFAAARPDTVQQGLNALVHTDGLPAALASVKDREGRTRTYTRGRRCRPRAAWCGGIRCQRARLHSQRATGSR